MYALFSEQCAPLERYGSANVSSEANTGYVNVSKYARIAVVCHAILVGTSLDIDIEIATNGSGAGVHTLKSIAALSGTDDDSLVVIEINGDELTDPAGASSRDYDWLNVEINASGTCAVSVVIYGLEPRYQPVDQTLWDEVVN